MRRRKAEDATEPDPRATGRHHGVSGRKFASENSGEPTRIKRDQRKPPLPTAATHVAGGSKAVSTRDRGLTRDKPPKPKKKAVERECKADRGLDGEAESGSFDGAGGVSQREHTASLHLHLRQAADEIEGLHRELAGADQERSAWHERDDEHVNTVSRLENRCDALEGCLRAESDGADVEKARAKESEAKFNRLLVWARAEEGRRRQAEQRLSRTREGGKVLEARIKVVEKEALEISRQLDDRRYRLEGALEDLRSRTAENERLEAQPKLMRGEVEALRELADARGLETKELREKMVRVAKEAKAMSSENVNLRKQLSAEQERWRAAERSSAKRDDRRRMEMEQKSDDVHALRYRIQELEARLSGETARRQGAEEDTRRSQEMERRSMEELMETRKAAGPGRTNLSRSFPPHNSERRFGDAPPVEEPAWHSWGSDAQDNATTVAPTSSATRSWIFPDVSAPIHCRKDLRYHPPHLQREHLQREEWTAQTGIRTPSKPFPVRPGAFVTAPPPPLKTTVSSSASPLRGRRRLPQSEGASAGHRPLSTSPEGLNASRRGRPRPRQAPSEDCDMHSAKGGVGRDGSWEERDVGDENSSEVGLDAWGVGSGEDCSDDRVCADDGVSRLKEKLFDVVSL